MVVRSRSFVFRPKVWHFKRRYKDWLRPPKCCDVCGGPSAMVSNAWLLGTAKGPWPWIYFCLWCEAYVSCHADSVYPMGRMANTATRQARAEVHALLDPLWEGGGITRSQAYAHLTALMGLPSGQTAHIGNFSLEECQLAADRLRQASLVDDFGA